MVLKKRLLILAILASAVGCGHLQERDPSRAAGISGSGGSGNPGLPEGPGNRLKPLASTLLIGRFAVNVEGVDRGMSGRFEWVSGSTDQATDIVFLQDSWGRSQAILRRSLRPAIENMARSSKLEAPLGEWVLHNARNQPMDHTEVNDWLGQHLGIDVAGLEPLGRMLSEGLGRLQQPEFESTSVVLHAQLQSQRRLTLRIIADRDPASLKSTPSPR
jgi:hypothetical protein